MKKILYWFIAIIALILFALFYFRSELVVMGSILELENDVSVFHADYRSTIAEYSVDLNDAVKNVMETKTTGGLIALASLEKEFFVQCRYKRMAIENEKNPALVEGLLKSEIFVKDGCTMNKQWYKDVEKASEVHITNTLNLLRESGVKNPSQSFVHKLNALLSD